MNENFKNILDEMDCEDNSHIVLKRQEIQKALQLKGERLFLKLTYKELAQEFSEQKIKSKLIEALSISVCFEDDGSVSEKVKEFVKYLYENSEEEQHLQFGIKKVNRLSPYPIKILFSAILPINQLEMAVEENLYNYIQEHRQELQSGFKSFRKSVSKEIKIPILPLKHYSDSELKPYSIRLIDSLTKESICECSIEHENMNIEDIISSYLKKLFTVYLNICQIKESKKD